METAAGNHRFGEHLSPPVPDLNDHRDSDAAGFRAHGMSRGALDLTLVR